MVTRLFVVHGMGEFDDSWVKPTETILAKIYGSYPTLASEPQKDRFTVHPIRYDDILSKLVKMWQTDAKAISKLADDVGASTAEAMVGWLKTAGQGAGWTHAADVLLYRCFSDVREAVQVAVANQIVKVVNADLKKSQDCRWGVVAHSLGTAVTHDALHALWTTKLGGASFSPANVKAAFVMMVANVSRVLETGNPDVLKSVVQPGTATNKTRGCLNFLTVRHLLDPFTVPRMFEPLGWPDVPTVKQGRYKSIEVRHVHDPNVHGFRHYLLNPLVHIPLMRLLANDSDVISADEADKAIAQFPEFGDLPKDVIDVGLKRLELMQPRRSDEWNVIRAVWDAYFGA